MYLKQNKPHFIQVCVGLTVVTESLLVTVSLGFMTGFMLQKSRITFVNSETQSCVIVCSSQIPNDVGVMICGF